MTTNWLDFNSANDQVEPNSKEHLKELLLSNLQTYLPRLLPTGTLQRNQFLVGNIDGVKGKSLSVELQGTKAGMWRDFATGEGGDIFDLFASVWNVDLKTSFTSFLERLGEWLGVFPCLESSFLSTHSEIGFKEDVKSRHIVMDDLGRQTAKWDYTDAEGNLIACVYRYDPPEGKVFRPWDVKARKHRTPEPRPLYNQVGMKQAQEVILVEGEKCADALIRLGFCATTAMNGAKAPLEKTDWSPLKGKHVLIWPDNDPVGKEYATAVANFLVNQNVDSLAVLQVPEDKPEKWDVADAVAEGLDIGTFLAYGSTQNYSTEETVPFDMGGDLDKDRSPLSEDLLAPRILTPKGLLVLGGAPKVGKSDFLLALLVHMALGVPFLGMSPPRPLRIFYLQTEVGRDYMRERLQSLVFDRSLLPLLNKNLCITRQLRILLNANGVAAIKNTINKVFPPSVGLVDVVVVDPLRNVFDGGERGANENDNTAMSTFLQDRLEALRDAVNLQAGIILVHHTRKLSKEQLVEDPLQALSGASALRGFYTSGMLLFRPDEQKSERHLYFELRNGPGIPYKRVDKEKGQWTELDRESERLINKMHGKKLDAERDLKREIILQLIFDEAYVGRVYTTNQFCKAFENRKGLGGEDTIRRRLDVLATKGYIKFFRNASDYGLPNSSRTKYGFLCVEDMQLPVKESLTDPETGEVKTQLQTVYPTHYRCRQTADALPVENSHVWVYYDEENA